MKDLKKVSLVLNMALMKSESMSAGGVHSGDFCRREVI